MRAPVPLHLQGALPIDAFSITPAHAWLNLPAKGSVVPMETTQAEVFDFGNLAQIVAWLGRVTCTEIDVVQAKPF